MRKRFRFFFALPLLLAGALAVTQESSPGESAEETPETELLEFDPLYGQELEAGLEPEISERPLPSWVRPVRWFRSNPGGMMLEEIPSRLAALRNEYALAVDFAEKEELPEKLLPFYEEQYYIEVRILYENGDESRRQWIFRDENGLNRLIAVFIEPESPENTGTAAAEIIAPNEVSDSTSASTSGAIADSSVPAEESVVVVDNAEETEVLYVSGFVEIYNESRLLSRELLFFDNGEERETEYSYRNDTLIKAETSGKSVDGEDGEPTTAKKLFTDNYRYNRSHFLRYVERLYHDRADENTVRLTFPNRAFDGADDSNFITEKLYIGSDFFGPYSVEENQRMIFTTDERGRILTQTLVDSDDKEIWVIINTWANDRIVSAEKIQGNDSRLNEYEYSSEGNIAEERNYRNGVLERRQIRGPDGSDVEELFIKGVVALRAVWKDGRKISEERVHARERGQ